MESETAQRLFERLRQLRKAFGLTQEKLAERAQLKYKHYQAIETGRKTDIRFSTLIKLAKAFTLEPWELLHPTASDGVVAEHQAKYGQTPGPAPGAKTGRPRKTPRSKAG